MELLANVGLGEEVLGGKNRKVTKPGGELLVVLEHLGVHDVRGNVAVGDLAVLLGELALGLGEVDRVEEQTGASIELPAATEGISAEGFGETSVWLAHHALEELENRSREVELRSPGLNILRSKLVGYHELRKISHHLRGRSDLDDVSEKLVGMLVGLLRLGPLRSKAELRGLEHHVGELATRNLVLVNLGVGAGEMGLEGRVEETELTPVLIDGPDMANVEVGLEFAAFERGEDGVDARLRSHARQAIGGSIDDVGTSLSTGRHGSDTGTRRVVGVDVDGQVGVFLANGADQKGSGVGLENTSHVLDAKDVDVKLDKLIDELKVVVEVVLLLGVQHVTAVANGTLDHTASLVDGLDTDLELVDVVKGVEYSEDVDAILLSLVDKVVDGVVGERGVGDTVGASEKHLEGDVGYELSHTAKSVPGVFVEEAHGNIEGGASPALQTVEIGQSVAGLLGDVEKVDRSNTRRQERLVGIAPCGIHNHATLVRPNGLGESLGALLENNLAQTLLARLANIDLVAIVVGKLWEDNLALEFGLTNLALDAAAVDGDITEVAKKLLGTVLTADKVEEGGGIVDKGGPAVSADKGGVGEEGGKEGNVGLHTTNAEFHESSEHLPPGNFVG